MIETFKKNLLLTLNGEGQNITKEDIEKLLDPKAKTKMIERKVFRGINDKISGGSMYSMVMKIQ